MKPINFDLPKYPTDDMTQVERTIIRAQRLGLTPAQREVLDLIRNWQGDTPPTKRYLTEQTGYNNYTVYLCLSVLEHLGLIYCYRNRAGNYAGAVAIHVEESEKVGA